MTSGIASTTVRLAAIALLGVAVTGCNMATRLSEVGSGPELSTITNPTALPDYRPVSMPMPTPQVVEDNPNSLWRAGAKAFFKDTRAKEIGDILTIELSLSDSATLKNKTTRARDDSEDANVTNLLGLEGEFSKVLPQGIAPTSLVSWDTDHATSGDGTIERSEAVTLTFAAVITQILPNGNLVVVGRQEIRVNSELRELMVSGVIRPEDIDSDNTISHTKIAEMRVAYGGRGSISEIQMPRWGTQVWDIVFPF